MIFYVQRICIFVYHWEYKVVERNFPESTFLQVVMVHIVNVHDFLI